MPQSAQNAPIRTKILAPPVTLATFILSLVAIFGLWAEVFVRNDLSKEITPIVILLTIYVIGEKISDLFAGVETEKIRHEIIDAQEKITGAIQNQVEFRYIGDHVSGLRYVVERARRATRIRDTFLRSGEYDINSCFPTLIDKYNDEVRKSVENDGFYEVIVSQVYVGKYAERTGRGIEAMNPPAKDRVQVWILDNGVIPISNVIIFTYGSNDGASFEPTREVLFGWSFDRSDPGLVISSTDENIVEYFDHWFDALKQAAQPAPGQGTSLLSPAI